MSRNFAMQFEFEGVDPSRVEAIREALAEEWPETVDSGWWLDKAADGTAVRMTSSGDGKLYGGEGDDDFAERIRNLVWTLNGVYCDVLIRSTYLDDPPTEDFQFDEMDYQEWLDGDDEDDESDDKDEDVGYD